MEEGQKEADGFFEITPNDSIADAFLNTDGRFGITAGEIEDNQGPKKPTKQKNRAE